MSAAETLLMSLDTQLTLNVRLQDDACFATFYEGPNAHIVRYLRALVSPNLASFSERQVFLCGAPSTGKSHLLQALCRELTQRGGTSMYLPIRQLLQLDATALEDLDQTDLVCIDDLDRVAGLRDWELGLFNLINNMRINEGVLVLASRRQPKDIAIEIPDLSSRLVWGPIFRLKRLSDDNKIKALQTHATRRGMDLRYEVARYLLNHFPRNLNELVGVLDRLDRASLANHRRLTIPFVKLTLQR